MERGAGDDVEPGSFQHAFHDPDVCRELLTDVGFEVVAGEAFSFGAAGSVDPSLQVRFGGGRFKAEDDVPRVEGAAGAEHPGCVEECLLFPESTPSACVRQFDDLPHGVEILLAREVFGDVELSGGQWQRLGCSRTHSCDNDAGRVCGHLELLKRHGFYDMARCGPQVPCAGSRPSASASARGVPRRNSRRSSERGPRPGSRVDRRRVGGCRRRLRRAGREVGRDPPERVNITRQDHWLGRLH